MLDKVIEKINEQQKGIENTAAYAVGEQLKDIIKETPAAAEQAADMEEKLQEALKHAEESEKRADTAESSIKGMQFSMSELRAELDKAKADVKKYKKLSKNPEIPQQKIDELKKQAELQAAETKAKEIEAAIEKTKNELEKAESARRNAEVEADKARLEIEELKKKILLADPAVTEFKVQFNTVQDTMNKMKSAFDGINDTDMQKKFKQAVKAMLQKYQEEFGI